MNRTFCCCTLLFSLTVGAVAQEVKRKAGIGAMVSMSGQKIKVDSVMPALTFDRLGIQKNDVLLTLNGTALSTTDGFYRMVSGIRTDSAITIEIERGKKKSVKKGRAVMKPYETNEHAEVIYDWVPYQQGKLRVITKKPKGKNNCPAVLFIPGYNCASIEYFASNYNGRLINEWIKAGYAVVCIEKSGNGDSYGCQPCTEVDMKTDIETFSLGYEYMQQLPFADRNNLFIWGHSMGGIIAPVLAEKYQPRGVIAFATVYRPWSEFLPEMHRIQYPLDGKTYEETERFVRGMHKVYYEFFINKKSPGQIAQINELKALAISELGYQPGNDQMWGRHWRFWQQIDSLDLAVSWSRFNGRVLSVYGGADFIACSELEHRLIVDAVNAAHPGNATYLKIDDIDHLMAVNHSYKESAEHLYDKKYQDTHFNYTIAEKTITWMNETCKR